MEEVELRCKYSDGYLVKVGKPCDIEAAVGVVLMKIAVIL